MESNYIRIQIGPKGLVLLKYIIESYDNLATLSTIDPDIGVIEIAVPDGNLSTVEELLTSVKDEIRFDILEKGRR